MLKLNQLIYYKFFRVFFLFLITLLFTTIINAQEITNLVTEEITEITEIWWVWHFLGKLHPLLVHFPVALLVIASIMELAKIRFFHSSLRSGINWLVYIGTLGAVLSVLLGLLLANTESYAGETFEWHKWAGIITATLAIITSIFLWLNTKTFKKTTVILYRGTLLITVLGVFMTGHYGGSLTHGQDFLMSTTPWAPVNNNLSELGGGVSSSDFDFASYSIEADSLSEEQQVSLNLAARTIIAHHCFQCHSSDKMEGELRLDDKDLLFKGGESGAVIIPGDATSSELVRRITLPPGHKEAMPGKGKPLQEKDIALIKLWIDKGAPWPDHVKGVFQNAPLAPRKPTIPQTEGIGMSNPIDRFVNSYFEEKGIQWPQIVDDRAFLRRIYFDLIGLPPTSEELSRFQADMNVDKRTRKIEELLSRDYDYATHWTTFWNDLLRNDYTGTGYITQGRFNISAWLYSSLLANKSYQQFVKELLDPSDDSKGFIKGIAWRGEVNSSQTTAMQAAQNVSQALLGINLKCASCHDSFVSDWKLDDAYAFANIFSEQPLEINRCDIPTGEMADTRLLWPELGEITSGASVEEKSKELSVLLTKPENGRLYRTLVNRIWAQLMGRGIISPTDEMDNAPWSSDLLDWMAVNFVEEGYDIKKLLYLITTSKTYQLSTVAVKDPSKINSADFMFTGLFKRKLTAEQFSDAVSILVHPVYGTDALKYNPYDSHKEYLNPPSFVRAALVQNDAFQTALGRPSRENITSLRDNQGTLLQAMELTNGTKLNETLVNGAKKWITKYDDPEVLIRAIYTQSLTRDPSEEEFKIAKKLFGEKVEEASVQELLWAIVLLPEFQFIE